MNKPTVPEVAPLWKALYEQAASGGPCHIVTDDGNLEASSIQWCIDNLIENWNEEARRHGEEACRISQKLLPLLLRMSKTQRRKLYNRDYYGQL